MFSLKSLWNRITTTIANKTLRCQCLTKHLKCCKNNQKFKVSYLDEAHVKTVLCCGIHLRQICKKPVFSVYIIRKNNTCTPYDSLIIKYDHSPVPDSTLVKLTKEITIISTLLFRKLLLINDCNEEEICCICLDSIYNKFSFQKNRTLACNHTFHDKCITKWMRHKNTCPMCREDISMN